MDDGWLWGRVLFFGAFKVQLLLAGGRRSGVLELSKISWKHAVKLAKEIVFIFGLI
jgi:hypothetical protein